MDNQKPLDGTVALVTGASRGIGLAIARKLGKMGARLSICSKDRQNLEAAKRELGRDAQIFAEPVDVTQAEQISSFVAHTEQNIGPVEILVNNAGIGYFGAAHEASDQIWDSVLDTNLKSVFLVCKAVAPGMIERRSGHIINIASLAGKNTFRNGGIYCASKWGLLGLSGCMAEDLRAYGIRVSAICPGSVATEFSHHESKDPSKLLQPDDIAHAVGMLVTQARQSFISEVIMRPTQKP